jgi:hypothetical protein
LKNLHESGGLFIAIATNTQRQPVKHMTIFAVVLQQSEEEEKRYGRTNSRTC